MDENNQNQPAADAPRTVEGGAASGMTVQNQGVETPGSSTTPQVSQEQGKVSVQVPEILKPAQGQPPVSSDDKIWGLVSYIPLLALMALVLKPGSAFIKLHGRQGLLIFLIFFFSIFIYIVPYIGPLIGIIIHFGMIGIGLFSMYQAFIGNWWKIPVLGDISELIPVEMFAKVTREAVMVAKLSEEIEQKSVEEEAAKVEAEAISKESEQTPAVSAAQDVPNTTAQADKGGTTQNAGNVQQQLPISDGESQQTEKK